MTSANVVNLIMIGHNRHLYRGRQLFVSQSLGGTWYSGRQPNGHYPFGGHQKRRQSYRVAIPYDATNLATAALQIVTQTKHYHRDQVGCPGQFV